MKLLVQHKRKREKAYEKNGVLYLQTNKKVLISNNIAKGSIIVRILQNQVFEEIDLFLKAGKLDADRLIADKLEVKNSAGQVCIKNFSAKKAQFECGAGSLCGKGDAAEKIEVNCGVGEVNLKLKGNKNDYNYDLKCGIGEIRCGNDQYSGIGRKIYLDHRASKKIEVACGIGQIDIDYVAEV